MKRILFFAASAAIMLPSLCDGQFSLASGDHTFEIGGDIMSGYSYEFYPSGTTDFHNNNFVLDEARIFVKGRVSNDVEYKFWFDFADLINDIQAPANGILDGLKDAWVMNRTQYVDIRTGYQRVPYSFNSLVDEVDDPFLKRPIVTNRLFNRRDLGIMLSHSFPEEHITLYGGVFSGMGQNVFSTPNPSGTPNYVGRIEFSYPSSKSLTQIIDMHDSPNLLFQCGVNASQTNDGISTFDGDYLINFNGSKTVYGADASIMYRGLSLQFETQQAKVDSAMFSEGQQYNYFKEGGYLAEINYYYRPLKSALAIRYDELNPNDLIYGNTQRTVAVAYNYFIKQNALCLKATYEHYLDLTYPSGTVWKNDALIVEMQVIF